MWGKTKQKITATTLTAFILLTTSILSPQALAYDNMPSVTLQQTQKKIQENQRTQILHDYLQKYDSPLAPHARVFIQEADKNHLDWKLVAAIAGVESYFGHYIPYNSYNGWGFGVFGNNVRRFESWEQAIQIISKSLKTDYQDKWKAQNVYQIGRIYAADPLWSFKVNHFLSEIETFEQTYQNTKKPKIPPTIITLQTF